MKRGILLLSILVLAVISFAGADSCLLNVSLVNQDPYPAIPGESVKVVFQINGVSNPDCKSVEFEVKENFPFTVDPESPNPLKITAGVYVSEYSSFYLAPYKLRVDKNALKGDNKIEVSFSSQNNIKNIKSFNINVENTFADFEVYVKDYNVNTRILTLEILNIADVDVEALTIEIPKQDDITIKGANYEVVGNLDSNEYTTADFEAITKEGNFSVNILYTDSSNTRREITKTIHFDPAYFTDLSRDKTSQPIWLYVLIVAVIGFIVWRVIKKRQMKKKLHHK